jgi:hypothetical protein
MKKYYNDFYILTAPPSVPFVPGGNINFTAEIDVNNYNSLTFVNLSNRLIKIPNTGPDLNTGLTLMLNDRFILKGNKNEINKGQLQVLFLNSNVAGRLLVIRKKYI